ncbi:CDP-alcohol phosphatidyltransferase family protein [Jatrophihabitans telluris]|uniref:CDP-alcohol phosphatidyltransferase family protein n=1 Tax=Jatrophihabitans telluris TaxID=2038343 RepID=A0ABY4R0R6_9ACTN|nr:CDP-alcohol phosphatidyltransferase family protein [Jatrophihabitans telluris]UQX89354.1 CDP-alcohol phosphatidyltransferase family protein [Jatrophihabitans telluris]
MSIDDRPAADGRIGPERSYRDVVAALAAAQKPAKGAPAYSRFINRKLGRYLAAAGYKAGRTPNQITAISAMFSFTGIAVLALVRPQIWTGVLIAVCLVLGYAFDAADGQLARLRGGGSKAGEWLDHIVDSAKISGLHLAVLISCYRFFGFHRPAWLLVPVAFTLVANVSFFGMLLNDFIRREVGARRGRPVEQGAPSTLRSALVIPTDYGVLCLAFLLLGWHHAFFGVYAVLGAASAGYLLLASVKWFRDMSALDNA